MDYKEEDYWRSKNLDGIICQEKYKTAKVRILFIGHEPWVKTEEEYKNYEGEIQSVLSYGVNPTGNTYFASACDIASGLLEIAREGCLFNTAFINLKKCPRIGAKEIVSEIDNACDHNLEYIFKQIKEIDPEIIIGSNILDGKRRLWNSWEKYRNDRLLHISFNDCKFEEKVYNNNMDFYIEKKSKMILVDVPHLASGSRGGMYSFKKNFVPIIVQGYNNINNDKYIACESWVSRRNRCQVKRL